MIISVDVDAPTSSDRRMSWVVGGVFAALVLGMTLIWSLQSAPTPRPNPPPQRDITPLTDDQETYVLYASWLQSQVFAECMSQRGFPREAVAGPERSKVEVVAAHLGVAPKRPDSWLAPAEARSGRLGRDASRAGELYGALKDSSDGGCQVARQRALPANATEVSAAVSQAVRDPDFTAYLAETSWLAAQPADALLYQTHVLMAAVDGDSPPASERWLDDLDTAVGLVTARGSWSVGPTEGYQDFAQGVVIAGDGSLLVVRVGDPSVIDNGFVSNMSRPLIDCGSVGVTLGTGALPPQPTDAAEPYSVLLAKVCNALR